MKNNHMKDIKDFEAAKDSVPEPATTEQIIQFVDQAFPDRHEFKVDWLRFEADIRRVLTMDTTFENRLMIIDTLLGEHTGRGTEMAQRVGPFGSLNDDDVEPDMTPCSECQSPGHPTEEHEAATQPHHQTLEQQAGEPRSKPSNIAAEVKNEDIVLITSKMKRGTETRIARIWKDPIRMDDRLARSGIEIFVEPPTSVPDAYAGIATTGTGSQFIPDEIGEFGVQEIRIIGNQKGWKAPETGWMVGHPGYDLH